MEDFTQIVEANFTPTQLKTAEVLARQGAYADVAKEFNGELNVFLLTVETWR